MTIISSERRATYSYGYSKADLTVGHILADKARKNTDKVFMTYLADGRTFTYAEIDTLTNRMANALLDKGVNTGDHIAVIMENSPEQVLLYLALAKIGAVCAPLNTSSKGRQLAYFLQHADVSVIIADVVQADRILAVQPECPLLREIILFGAEGPLPDAAIGLHTFDSLYQGPDTRPDLDVGVASLAMLMYTSGTTGPSKANMLTQSGVIQYGMTTAEAHGYRNDDIVYISLPLSHANAYLCTLWGALISDGAVALSHRFSVSRYWDEIRSSKATITNMLGSMPNMVWSRPSRPDDSDNNLRICNLIPVPPFAAEFEHRYGLRVVSSYGQTDFASATVFTTVDPVDKLGSAGRARPGIELAVVDENDLILPVGAVGELVLRTSNTWSASLGYYKNPEATLTASRNGWWHTGDHCYIDADGYLFFAARKKESLRRRGENISIYEVESVLSTHPAVQEAAVYGLRTAEGEDEVVATLQVDPAMAPSHEEILDFCIRNMSHFMVPRYLELVEALPRTDNFKVKKQDLKDRAAADPSRLWDREAHGIFVTRDTDALQYKPLP